MREWVASAGTGIPSPRPPKPTVTGMNEYKEFLEAKAIRHIPTGIDDPPALGHHLFDFQRDIVRWALKKGRAAIFADCGMGKTAMQLEWAKYIPGKVLILAPLAVSAQTVREGKKFGVEVEYSRHPIDAHVTITNYEMLDKFNPGDYTGIVLDESSILKSYDGKFRTQIIESFSNTPFRLACTATPAPNDHMELGNHAEFLGAMSRVEMLSTFFVHDGGDTSKWRLKGHAETDFWKWMCSWAVMIRKPSDLGYHDGDFVLPPLNIHHRIVETESRPEGALFAMEATTLIERKDARRLTISERSKAVTDIVASKPDEPWLIWCNLNDESKSVIASIETATEITGSDSHDIKESRMLGFSNGDYKILVTKPSIAGFGMNWQHCSNVVFLGLSDSYEQFYQAIRRCWRFGQNNHVDCYIVTSDSEGAVVANINRKESDSMRMAEEMVGHMHDLNEQEIHGTVRTMDEYTTAHESGDGWDLHLGDCVEVVSAIPSDSIGYSIFSPPFASLYTYSASDRDMGNCKNTSEFYNHFRFLASQLHRVTKPGRLLSFHCMNLPASKERDGFIGIKDFRGDMVRIFQEAGFVFHSEVCIWKDPVTAMQRTKAIGLLWKQLKKDSTISRQGIPDYLVTMRKLGTNPEPVAHSPEDFPVALWQQYASPVWMDINPSDTLQKESAREEQDERHICPLQLEVIRRAVKLWSNPNDLVLSPFTGIGSEGFTALKMGRRFVGAELKRSYFNQAVANLRIAARDEIDSTPLFDMSTID